MPMTMKEITKRYGTLSVVKDPAAPVAAEREDARKLFVELADRIEGLYVERAQLFEKIEEFEAMRRDVEAKLKSWRVVLRAGATNVAAGIDVGHGDTLAEARADAARRLGRE